MSLLRVLGEKAMRDDNSLDPLQTHTAYNGCIPA